MKYRKILLLVALIAGAALLSLVLIRPAKNLIIIPAIKMFWVASGVYHSFPQAEYWVFVLIIIIVVLGIALMNSSWTSRKRISNEHHVAGEVQQLAYWISRSRKGIYSRWHLARRMADLSMEILESAGSNVKRTRLLQGQGWNPPPVIRNYLSTALRTSYADFAKRSASEPEASLEVDLNQVVDYLESYMESNHEHRNT